MSRITWDNPTIITTGLVNISETCHECHRLTNHLQLVQTSFNRTYHADDEYNNSMTCYDEVIILQCQGCMNLKVKHEMSNSEDIECINGDYESIKTTEYYPKHGKVKSMEKAYLLPNAIRGMYTETISAINNDCLIIAGIGIRGIIETICQEEGVESFKLDKKIDELFTRGKISNDNREILHSLRKLYNKSAHESLRPSEEQLKISLEIVEVLLRQIYVHSDLAKLHFKNDKA